MPVHNKVDPVFDQAVAQLAMYGSQLEGQTRIETAL